MIRVSAICLFVVLSGLAVCANVIAHESQPGTLYLRQAAKDRYEVTWRAPIYYGMPHPARLVLPDGWKDAVEPTNRMLPDSQVFRRVVTVGDKGILSLDSSLLDNVMKLTWNQSIVRGCAVVFFWVGVVSRTAWSHSYCVYRALLLEAGHVCQNLYLAADAVDAGVCAIGGFVSAELGKLFKLVEDEEIVLYVASLGKKKQI